MSEGEWLGGGESLAMLDHLLGAVGGSALDRRFRVFACAILRDTRRPLGDRRCRKALETAERYAWGLTDRKELQRAARLAEEAVREKWQGVLRGTVPREEYAFLCAVRDNAAAETGFVVARAVWQTQRPAAGLVREIFGNPFRPPSLPPHWRAWNRGTIPRLARHICDEGRFDEMPVLGDALEEAGCADEHILVHCRAVTAHVQGCWVLHLLLGDDFSG